MFFLAASNDPTSHVRDAFVMIGGVPLTLHTITLLIVTAVFVLMMIGAAKRIATGPASQGNDRYVTKGRFAQMVEAITLYMRDEMLTPVMGEKDARRYLPYLMSLFFFIMVANTLGLIPYGASATGNLAVTGTLALITLVMVEVAGMKALGAGYMSTIVYWPHDMPFGMKLPLSLILTPVEIIGKFTKPFALAIRLFANMTAGHIVVLALMGLIFQFAGPVSAAPFLMTMAIMLLEIFVAFLQAFIFTLLSAVFIGQIRELAH